MTDLRERNDQPTDTAGSRPASPHRRRPWGVAAAIAFVVLVASACQIQEFPPTGEGPLRYRDVVFTQVTTTSGVTYGSAVNQQGQTQSLALDVYQPIGDTLATRPAIVWVHGGSFRSGTRTSPELVDQATTFAKKGFVNVSITYRLSPTGCSTVTPVCLQSIAEAREDAQAAVRFLRANAATYGIDTDRIAIAGTSAGAITALNVAYGADVPGNSGNPGHSSEVRAAVSLSGAHILTTPDAGEPPVLLLHGTADTITPYAWAQNTITLATDAGLEAYLTTWDGAGHVPYSAHRTEILDHTTNFLYWTMNLTNAPQ